MLHITDYLRFLISSTNQHGVHSPFLFHYLTRCLYVHGKRYPSKAIEIIMKSIPYFGIQCTGIFPEDLEIKKAIARTHPYMQFGKPPYDLLVLAEPDPVLLTSDPNQPPLVHNNTLCLIQQVHSSNEHLEKWGQVKALDMVQVTVDAYHCGLVFFRKEQAEQHFKIRI